MILTQILQPSCVRAPLVGEVKDAVITELVDLLAESGQLKDRDVVLESVHDCECCQESGDADGYSGDSYYGGEYGEKAAAARLEIA